MKDLFPCPWCGNKPGAHPAGHEGFWRIACSHCFALGPSGNTVEEARRKWDMRKDLFPRQQLEGSYPVVLYFDNRADVDAFVKLVQEAKPNLKSEAL